VIAEDGTILVRVRNSKTKLKKPVEPRDKSGLEGGRYSDIADGDGGNTRDGAGGGADNTSDGVDGEHSNASNEQLKTSAEAKGKRPMKVKHIENGGGKRTAQPATSVQAQKRTRPKLCKGTAMSPEIIEESDAVDHQECR
jgi:hypothetical protein